MADILRWTASDTAIKPRFDLTREGVPVDLTSASRVSVQFSRAVPSGAATLVASYLATVLASHNATEGLVEVLTYASAPLATSGKWLAQVTLTSAGGVETFQSPFTVMIRARF